MEKSILILGKGAEKLAEVRKELASMGYQTGEGIPPSITRTPDLILLVPEKGEEISHVVQEVRSYNSCKFSPLLLVMDPQLTRGRDWKKKMCIWMELKGVDDLIWAYSPGWVILKAEKYLSRIDLSRNLNPITGLPGNQIIREEIKKYFICTEEKHALLYLDLNNFKPYNDYYGFPAGDNVIKEVGNLLKNALSGIKEGYTFIGHIGGDDFVAIFPSFFLDEMAEHILRNFEQVRKTFYHPTDFQRECIISTDREGIPRRFSLMNITMVSFSNQDGNFHNVEEVGEFAGLVKHVAKLQSNGERSLHYKTDREILRRRTISLYALSLNEKIPVSFRRAAVEAMGESGDIRHEETLLKLLADEGIQPMLKKSVLYALGRLRSQKALPRIFQILSSPNAHLRMRAVEALGNIGTADAVPLVKERLGDKNLYVKRMAALTLSKLGDRSVIPHLKRVILAERDEETRKNAIVSLTELGGEKEKNFIIQLLERTSLELKRRVIWAMGELKAGEALMKTLEIMRKEKNALIKYEAALALRKIILGVPAEAREKILPELRKSFDRSVPFLKNIFLEILGLIKSEKAFPYLKEGSKDKDYRIRMKSVESLGELGTGPALSLVVKSLHDPHPLVRRTAALRLGRIHNLKALEPLRQAVKDKDRLVRQQASESIIEILKFSDLMKTDTSDSEGR